MADLLGAMLPVSDTSDLVNECTQEISHLMKLHIEVVWQNAYNLLCSWLIGGPRLTWDDHRKLDGLTKLYRVVVVVVLVVVVCGSGVRIRFALMEDWRSVLSECF